MLGFVVVSGSLDWVDLFGLCYPLRIGYFALKRLAYRAGDF